MLQMAMLMIFFAMPDTQYSSTCQQELVGPNLFDVGNSSLEVFPKYPKLIIMAILASEALLREKKIQQ